MQVRPDKTPPQNSMSNHSVPSKISFPLLPSHLFYPYIWIGHITDFSIYKSTSTMDNKKRPLEKYLAPTVEVVQVDVERGFAVSAPGYGDGGVW